jgi:hypothetical protein
MSDNTKHAGHAADCCIHIGYGICNCGALLGRVGEGVTPPQLLHCDEHEHFRGDCDTCCLLNQERAEREVTAPSPEPPTCEAPAGGCCTNRDCLVHKAVWDAHKAIERKSEKWLAENGVSQGQAQLDDPETWRGIGEVVEGQAEPPSQPTIPFVQFEPHRIHGNADGKIVVTLGGIEFTVSTTEEAINRSLAILRPEVEKLEELARPKMVSPTAAIQLETIKEVAQRISTLQHMGFERNLALRTHRIEEILRESFGLKQGGTQS